MKRYQDYLIETLRDPHQAAAYLNAALEAGDSKMFLVALRNVAQAHGGMTKLARKAKLSRPNLYRMLSQNGQPEIQSLSKVLKVFGLTLNVTAQKQGPDKDLSEAA